MNKYILRHWKWIDKHPYSNPRVYDRVSGNYLLLRILGTGHYSYVFLAKNIHTKNLVALKFLKPLRSSTPPKKDKLLSEGRILEELSRHRHPHIVNIRDYDKDQHGRAYLVLDYIPGQTLQSKHPRGIPVALPTVIHYVGQIASALDYAHEHEILHRDLKQNNIMVNAAQNITLLDFGLSIDEKNSHIELPSGSSMGFPETMAPERWERKSQRESDVYALGVIVFELLSGQKLFEGNQDELEQKHKSEKPRSLHDLSPAIPEEVSSVVLKALAKKPEERFSSAGEFADALKNAYATAQQTRAAQALAAFIIALKEHAIPIVIAQQESRMRRTILRTMVAAVLAMATETILFRLKPALERVRPKSIAYEYKKHVEPGLLLSTYSTPHVPIGGALWLPDNTHILLNSMQNGQLLSFDTTSLQGKAQPSHYTLSDSDEQVVAVSLQRTKDFLAVVATSGRVYFWQWDTQTPLSTPTDYPTDVKKVAISPNGLHVAFVTRDNKILIYDSPGYYQQGGRDRIYCHHDEITSVSWSFDSDFLAFGSADKTVHVIHHTNPEPVWVLKGHRKEVTDIAFAPDRLHLLSSSMDKTVYGWDVSRQRPIFSYKDHTQGVLSVAWSDVGDQFVSGSLDQTAKIYDIYHLRDRSISTLQHSQPVYMLSWSGSRLATVGVDTVKVWQTGFYPQ